MPTPDEVAVHRIECGCGFAVEGAPDEAFAVARRHASEVHRLELADGLLDALAHPVHRTRTNEE